MEKPSGLKECPRCGMKNRQGAYQCDFCGWGFRTTSENWMGKVADLENISRDMDAPPLDRHVASKIEMTIKRPSELPVREPLPSSPEENVPETEERSEADVSETSPEARPVEDAAPAALPEAPAPEEPEETSPAVELPVEETPSPAEPTSASAPAASPAMAEPSPAAEPVRAGTEERGLPRSTVITFSMLGVGVALYIAALVLAADLGKVAGWGLTIVGALLIALSARRLFALYKKKEGDEIILCPNCHEVVSDRDPGCPSCGAKFTKPAMKG